MEEILLLSKKDETKLETYFVRQNQENCTTMTGWREINISSYHIQPE